MTEDGFDEGSEVSEGDLVEVPIGEERVQCVILAVIDHNGRDYAMVAPRDHLSEDATEVELLVAGWNMPNGSGNAGLEPITDEAVFREVAKIFADMVEGSPDID